jgi:predicted alpha/beta-hydrolase family hydrolase
MNHTGAERISIVVDDAHTVSGLLWVPTPARACYLLAHGAGAGMTHPFMHAIAVGLARRAVGTLRYQFPYMEEGRRRPDSPQLAQATVRAAAAQAARLAPALPLTAGGKSFGGRMTSQAQAASPLPAVRGLAFLGFPLHPAKRPSEKRAAHLFDVHVPMLFLQGTRDALADVQLISSVAARLGERAQLHLLADADHSFHVPARSGSNDAEVLDRVVEALSQWIFLVASRPPQDTAPC